MKDLVRDSSKEVVLWEFLMLFSQFFDHNYHGVTGGKSPRRQSSEDARTLDVANAQLSHLVIAIALWTHCVQEVSCLSGCCPVGEGR